MHALVVFANVAAEELEIEVAAGYARGQSLAPFREGGEDDGDARETVAGDLL